MAERSEHAAERVHPSLPPLDSEIQVCGVSSYSLSIPSQPPDVRNWFSSYEYESPDSLGLPNDLGGFRLLDGNGDETQDPLEISAKRKDENPQHKHFNKTHQDAPDMRNSCSNLRLQNECRPRSRFHSLEGEQNLLSGIGKETFRSFENGSDGDCDPGVSRINENSVKDRKQSMKLHPAETEGSEHALHKECPKNACPVLSSMGGDIPAANEVSHEQDLLPRCSIRMDGFNSVKYKNPVRVESETCQSKLGSEVKCENLLASERNPGSVSCEVRSPKRNLPGVKRKQNLQQLFGEEFLADYCKDADDLASLKSNRSPIKDHMRAAKRSPEQSKSKKKLEGEDWRIDDSISLVGDTEPLNEESSPTCAYQELRANAATSSFMSTRNGEKIQGDGSGENVPPRPIQPMNHIGISSKNEMTGNGHMTSEGLVVQERHRNLPGKERAQMGKRSPLVDKTNLDSAAAAPEIPGKWRCPRKSKPYMGPPLKQLRLEHWIHRVN